VLCVTWQQMSNFDRCNITTVVIKSFSSPYLCIMCIARTSKASKYRLLSICIEFYLLLLLSITIDGNLGNASNKCTLKSKQAFTSSACCPLSDKLQFSCQILLLKKLPIYNFMKVRPSGAVTFHRCGRTSGCRSVFSQPDKRNTRTAIRETFLSAQHFCHKVVYWWYRAVLMSFQQTHKQQNTRTCFPTCTMLSPACNPYTAVTIERRSACNVGFCKLSTEHYIKLQSSAMWRRVA